MTVGAIVLEKNPDCGRVEISNDRTVCPNGGDVKEGVRTDSRAIGGKFF